jgi:type IX secretion system PorP/SprF family membrane protein
MRKLLLISCFTVASLSSNAQQRPIQSLYMFDPLLVNPAYAGNHVQLSATSIFRNQWVNLDGAPKTLTATVHSGFFKSKMGLGIIASNDKIGIHNETALYGVYSYKIKVHRDGVLSFGVQAGFNNLKSDFTKLNLKSINDPNLAGIHNQFNPNVGAGIYYRGKDVFAGFSVPQLMEAMGFGGETPALAAQQRYYYMYGGINKKVSQNFRVLTSGMIRAQENAPLSFDLNFMGIVYDVVGLGASYRLQEGIVAMFELQINENFHVGYGYDYTTSELNNFSNGSHEIMVNYRIKIQRIHRGLPCPTYW